MKTMIIIAFALLSCSKDYCPKFGASYHPKKQRHPRITAVIKNESVRRITIIDTVKIVHHRIIMDTVFIEKLVNIDNKIWRDSLHWRSYKASSIDRLHTMSSIIRFETQPGANTKARIANMFDAIINELFLLRGATIDFNITHTGPYTLKPIKVAIR